MPKAKNQSNFRGVFKKLKPGFKLADFRKYEGEEWLTDFYERIDKNEEFNFTIVIKNNTLRLKLKASLDLINKFLKTLMASAKFAEYTAPKNR